MSVLSGETIRMMNFVDDMTTTLRRLVANVDFMSPEDKKRLADYMRSQKPTMNSVLEMLEKPAK